MNDTTISSNNTDLEKFANSLPESEAKFPTECFWLTVLYHHICLSSELKRIDRKMKEMTHYVRELKRVKNSKPKNNSEEINKKVIFMEMRKLACLARATCLKNRSQGRFSDPGYR